MTTPTTTGILQRHMGNSFFRLAPLLQQAHTGHTRLQGMAEVRQGNWLARLLCRVMRFPAASAAVPLTVDCFHTPDHMTWRRQFGERIMPSDFALQGDFLVEYLGPLAMSFVAEENNGALHYRFVKTRFWGIPVPDFLSPQVEAFEKAVDGRYEFSVSVRLFLIGPVIAYRGSLALEILEDETH